MVKYLGSSVQPSMETGTVSAEEIARFAARADAWWDPSGDFAPLHKFNPPRLEFIRDALCGAFDRDFRAERPLAGIRLLDLGCGGLLILKRGPVLVHRSRRKRTTCS